MPPSHGQDLHHSVCSCDQIPGACEMALAVVSCSPWLLCLSADKLLPSAGLAWLQHLWASLPPWLTRRVFRLPANAPFGSGAQLFVSSGHYWCITSRGFQKSGSLNKLKVVASEGCHFIAFTSEPPQNSIHCQCPQDKLQQSLLLVGEPRHKQEVL